MKTIEQLKLENIVWVDRYLTDQLSTEETKQFERRLSIDNELRIDFKMVVETYKTDYTKLKKVRKSHIDLDEINPDMAFLRRKMSVGKKIIGYGLMAVLFSILLVVVCGVAMAMFS